MRLFESDYGESTAFQAYENLEVGEWIREVQPCDGGHEESCGYELAVLS